MYPSAYIGESILDFDFNLRIGLNSDHLKMIKEGDKLVNLIYENLDLDKVKIVVFDYQEDKVNEKNCSNRLKIFFFTTFALTRLLIGEQLGLKKVSQVAHKAIYITQPPSDSIRLYVLNQRGFIQIIKNGNTLKEPFLDISSQVNGSQNPGVIFRSEQGNMKRVRISMTIRRMCIHHKFL